MLRVNRARVDYDGRRRATPATAARPTPTVILARRCLSAITGTGSANARGRTSRPGVRRFSNPVLLSGTHSMTRLTDGRIRSRGRVVRSLPTSRPTLPVRRATRRLAHWLGAKHVGERQNVASQTDRPTDKRVWILLAG